MRYAVAAIWGATLALFALAFVLQDRARWSPGGEPGAELALLALCHGLGGAIAGFALARMFSAGGAFGWVLALLGAILTTLLGGLVGGALLGSREMFAGGEQLVQGLIRVGLGPMATPLAIADAPGLLAAWLAATLAAHLAARRLGMPAR